MDQKMVDETRALLKTTYTLIEEMLPHTAKLQKAYFDSLLSQGFTADHAMQILCSNPILPKT